MLKIKYCTGNSSKQYSLDADLNHAVDVFMFLAAVYIPVSMCSC